MLSINKPLLLRITVILTWVILIILMLDRDVFVPSMQTRTAEVMEASRGKSFTGVYFKNQRIGYVKQQIEPTAGSDLQLVQEAFLRLNIMEEEHPVRLLIRATLSDQMVLKDFTFRLTSPFYEMNARGKVSGSLIRFTLNTGKDEINDEIKLPKPPFLPTHQRAYLLNQGLQKGDKIRIPLFDPISLSGKESLLEYRGREKILIKGRIHNLHHFIETFSGIRINSWLNDEGRVVKEESPAGFVFLAEPEFKATDIPGKGREILSSVSIPLSGKLPKAGNSTTYRITMPEETGHLRIDDQRQQWHEDRLTISFETIPPADAAACAGAGMAEFLAPTPYIQATHPEIRALSKEITQNASTDQQKIIHIATWVHDKLNKRPVIGIPDALSTLRARQGDCNEHAALFAALARSTGIPTKVVAGVTLLDRNFFYHAWNEVCVGSTWLSVDTTVNQLPTDRSHIKFVEGEVMEMMQIGALIGKLAIQVLPEDRR